MLPLREHDPGQRYPRCLRHQLGVKDTDFQALVSLAPAELEVQADVLLRKRYDAVRWVLPVTCARLGSAGWQTFKEYARSHWPQDVPLALSDTRAFCDLLEVRNRDLLLRSELNRIRFVESSRSFSVSFVPDVPWGRKTHFGIQLLLRSGKYGWRELAVCFCL